MKEAKIIPENIFLTYVDLVESHIKDAKEKFDFSYKLNVAPNILHNLEEERMKIGLAIDIKSDNKDKDFSFYFNIDFHFRIKDLKDYYTIGEGGTPTFSGMFVSTLIGISFSTARGMIFERLSNTNISSLILPIVSPVKILSTATKNENEEA